MEYTAKEGTKKRNNYEMKKTKSTVLTAVDFVIVYVKRKSEIMLSNTKIETFQDTKTETFQVY